MKRWHRCAAAAAMALTALLVATAAAAQGAPIVDGKMWARSTLEERRAFLIGATNMISLELAYAKKHQTPPAPASDKASRAMNALTLDDIAARVTRWYAANPAKLATPVMGVIWTDIVEPRK